MAANDWPNGVAIIAKRIEIPLFLLFQRVEKLRPIEGV